MSEININSALLPIAKNAKILLVIGGVIAGIGALMELWLLYQNSEKK